MRILALNWRDPHNPEAGGAEIHLHEILKRAVAAGHEVIHVSHAIQWLPDKEVIDGVQIHRHGNWYSYNFTLKKYCQSLNLDSFDLIIEDICKVPVFSPKWSKTPVLAIVPHLFGTTAYREVSFIKALYVNALEAMIPKVTPLACAAVQLPRRSNRGRDPGSYSADREDRQRDCRIVSPLDTSHQARLERFTAYVGGQMILKSLGEYCGR